MRHRIFVTAAAVWVILLTARLAIAQNGQKQPAADWMTQRPAVFSVVLQIERGSNRGERAIDAKMVAAVCESSAVVDPVLTVLTQMPIDQVRPLVLVEAEPSGESFVTLKVTLAPQAAGKIPPDLGTKVLNEIAKRAAAMLTKAAESQIAPLREQRKNLDDRLAEAEAKFAEAEAAYRDAAPRVDTSGRSNGYDPRRDVEMQRVNVSRSLGAARARLASYLANKPTTQPAGQRLNPDTFAMELVEKREQALIAQRQALEAGKSTPESVAAAEDSLIEARLLAALSSRVGLGYQAPAFDEPSLRAPIAELEVQLASIDDQLAALPKPTSRPSDLMSQNDFQLITNDRNEARNRVQQIRGQRDNFDQQYGALRAPAITALTSE